MENLFLASLSTHDQNELRSVLKPVQLNQQQVLFEMGEAVANIYFPTNAVISLVLPLSTGELIEAAMVGRDGMVGASSALDGKIAMNLAIVQLGGKGLVCSSEIFKKIVLASPVLLSVVVRHEQTLYAQAQQSAACVARRSASCALAASVQGFGRHRHSAIYTRIFGRDARRSADKRVCRGAYAAACWHDEVQ